MFFVLINLARCVARRRPCAVLRLVWIIALKKGYLLVVLAALSALYSQSCRALNLQDSIGLGAVLLADIGLAAAGLVLADLSWRCLSNGGILGPIGAIFQIEEGFMNSLLYLI